MAGVQRIGVGPHLSHVAIYNGTVHLSGVVSPGTVPEATSRRSSRPPSG
jgi:hypothetical protein